VLLTASKSHSNRKGLIASNKVDSKFDVLKLKIPSWLSSHCRGIETGFAMGSFSTVKVTNGPNP
jgi:hypothetical protein